MGLGLGFRLGLGLGLSRLGDGERLVQVAQRVELPLLTLHHDVELLDTVEGQLVALDLVRVRVRVRVRGGVG